MNHDPMHGSQDPKRQDLSAIAVGMDLLVLARQMALEGASQARRDNAEGDASNRDHKAHSGNEKHEHDANGPLSEDDTAGSLVRGTSVHVESGHIAAAPLNITVKPEISPAHVEVGQHGLVGWSTPASLSGLLNAISELPSHWVMRSGDPAAAYSLQNLRPTFGEQGGSHLPGSNIATSANDYHITASLHASSEAAQSFTSVPSLPPTGGGQDESEARPHAAQTITSYAVPSGSGNSASQSASDMLSGTTKDGSVSPGAATAQVDPMVSQPSVPSRMWWK